MNPYEILGIELGASPEEIQTAYRKKCKEFHPDVNPGHDKEFRDVQSAYDMLTGDQSSGVDDHESKIRDEIIRVFYLTLEKFDPDRGNLVHEMQDSLEKDIADAHLILADYQRRLRRFSRVKPKLSGKDDLLSSLIDVKIGQIAGQISGIESDIKLWEEVVTKLSTYTYHTSVAPLRGIEAMRLDPALK